MGAIRDNNIQNRSADPPLLSSEAVFSGSRSVGQRQIRVGVKVEAGVVVDVVVDEVVDEAHCSNSETRVSGGLKVTSVTVEPTVEVMVAPRVEASSSLSPTIK